MSRNTCSGVGLGIQAAAKPADKIIADKTTSILILFNIDSTA
jgi:hypothetical protein